MSVAGREAKASRHVGRRWRWDPFMYHEPAEALAFASRANLGGPRLVEQVLG